MFKRLVVTSCLAALTVATEFCQIRFPSQYEYGHEKVALYFEENGNLIKQRDNIHYVPVGHRVIESCFPYDIALHLDYDDSTQRMNKTSVELLCKDNGMFETPEKLEVENIPYKFYCHEVPTMKEPLRFFEMKMKDPTCLGVNMTSMRNAIFNPVFDKYEVFADYCYNSTLGQATKVKIYLGTDKILVARENWKEYSFTTGKIVLKTTTSTELRRLFSKMTLEERNKINVRFDNYELVDNHLLQNHTNLCFYRMSMWNKIVLNELSIKVLETLKDDLISSQRKSQVNVEFKFSDEVYSMTLFGRKWDFYEEMPAENHPGRYPLPAFMRVNVEIDSKVYEFIIRSQLESYSDLNSKLSFSNCEGIGWLSSVLRVNHVQDVLLCSI